MSISTSLIILIPEDELPYSVQIVKIYLSSATFDEIEKEMKVGTTLI